ncbi:MAG: lipopolysaccharide heptosyltransferase II [Kiritimatiellae bacterium]|nr:lipopolysaccharide heptosyltransferase II [Kiritimatiellia bacterium]
MSVSPESASTEPLAPADQARRTLICGVNWLGDSVMAMPAVQHYRKQHPATSIAMLVKPKLAPLWRMHPDVDTVLELRRGAAGTLRAAAAVRRHRCDIAFVLPHSFRSALIPFLARVPTRVGMPGHSRDWMLTRVVRPPADAARRHQAHEYFAALGLPDQDAPMDAPRLVLADDAFEQARRLLRDAFGAAATGPDLAPSRWIGLIPGAAYGPAKRWPPERFAEVGRRLCERIGCGAAVLGTAQDRALCRAVTHRIGKHAVDLAAKTSIPQFTALLAVCELVICNDSGGMHLAAAAGTKTVAVFGITDPARTGPLGSGHRILHAGTRRTRDIPRRSALAAQSLRCITPDQVLAAASELLG